MYGGGFVFNQLEHLKLSVATDSASNLLLRWLEDSPNLRVLDLFEMVVISFFEIIIFGLMHTECG